MAVDCQASSNSVAAKAAKMIPLARVALTACVSLISASKAAGALADAEDAHIWPTQASLIKLMLTKCELQAALSEGSETRRIKALQLPLPFQRLDRSSTASGHVTPILYKKPSGLSQPSCIPTPACARAYLPPLLALTPRMSTDSIPQADDLDIKSVVLAIQPANYELTTAMHKTLGTKGLCASGFRHMWNVSLGKTNFDSIGIALHIVGPSCA